MAELFDSEDWVPGRRVYGEQVRGSVTVDASNRVYVHGRLVSPVYLTEYWHLFRAEVGADRWPAVVEAMGLPKKVRQTLRSSGLRPGQSRLFGRYPKRPIHIIQEERRKDAGEPSFRIDYRRIERMARADMAECLQSGTNDAPGGQKNESERGVCDEFGSWPNHRCPF